MEIRGTDFVMFQVSDLAAAARFYREVLGLRQDVYSEEGQWAEFSCGDVTLSLHGGGKPPEATASGRIALAVEDVQAARAELKKKGADGVGELHDYGVCRAVEVRDPDGNTVILHRRADGSFGQNRVSEDKDAAAILALERAAQERWAKGDPSGFLEISAPDVVYFSPSEEKRLDGLEALTKVYEAGRGKIHVDRYEFLHPKVQVCGDAAVLTYNFVGKSGGKEDRWNCTEVYRRTPDGWRIIHTHWSFGK
jgi:catechol 2,3-dioxygenase-like lactoylglutathione lyase family enzyme/ketosteroid isomerase-like protein